MRPYIDLYIDNQRLEFQEAPEILFTYAHTDLHNPTVVKNSFSKTITVDGTPTNNSIFGCFGNMNRVLEYADGKYTGAYFNPSRKVEFMLLRNSEPIERGYVKLDKVVKNGNNLKYEILLYGGLGQFLYGLTYKDDGEQRKLSDMEYGTTIDMDINKDTIRDAWNYINGIWAADNPNFTYDATVYDFINFAPCYNGIPEDFSADKIAIRADKFVDAWGDISADNNEGYTTVNGWILGELNKEYDEWQTRDLRSYLQRPVIRFKEIIKACVNPVNNGGYEVDLDPDFFNESNPYWENAWMTLPRVNEMEVEQSEDSSIVITPSGDTINVSGGTEGETVTYTFKIGLGCNVSSDVTVKSLQTGKVQESWDGSGESSAVDESTNVARYVQVVCYDSSGAVLGGSSVYSFHSALSLNDSFFYEPEYKTSVIDVYGEYIRQSDGSYLFGDKDHSFVVQNVPYQEGMYFKVVEKFALYQAGLTEANPKELYYLTSNGFDNDSGQDIIVINPVGVSDFFSYIDNDNGDVAVVTKSKKWLSKKTLLNSENTPCDYFLNYLKMFNLHIWSDNVEKKVYIRMRKNYFSGDIVDLDRYIDRGKDINITPIVFDAKYYVFENEIEEDCYIAKVYKDSYGIDYGIQKIDTNYNFDNSVKQLIQNNVFKGCVDVRGKSRYYVNTYSSEFSDNRPFPSCFTDGVQVLLFKDNDTKEGKYVTPKTTVDSTGWYEKKYMDIFPKPEFRDKEGKSIDGSNVLLFYNGKQEMKDVSGDYLDFQISDDIPEFEELNDGEPCWILSGLDDYTRTIQNLPVFSRYQINENKWITHSWDFGTPKENYIDGWTIDSTSSIYTNFWKSYMSDELNVNTREVECYVWFRGKVNPDYLKSFVYFDGCYWLIKEIIDYDVTSQRPTKVKMVKVQDIKNYKS